MMAVEKRDEQMALAPIEENVPGLIRLALEQRVPVEVLERLVALEERVSVRNARMAFFEALSAFRAECPPIQKTRENSQFSVTREGVRHTARYAALEDIDRVARPVASAHGLAWTWDTRVDGELMHVTCRLKHVTGHSEDTNVSMPYESKAGSSPQQKYGSTQTYGMRYSLIAALGITTTDEDADGEGATAPDLITDEQAADLQALVDEVGANEKKFLDWLGVGSIGEVRAVDLPRAIRALRSRIRR